MSEAFGYILWFPGGYLKVSMGYEIWWPQVFIHRLGPSRHGVLPDFPGFKVEVFDPGLISLFQVVQSLTADTGLEVS